MIKLEKISHLYRNKNNNVMGLKNISLSLPNKGFIAILGPSGCGKTTLLNILGSIILPTKGEYYFDNVLVNFKKGEDLQMFRRNNVTTVFQENYLFNDSSVKDNISYVNEIQRKVESDSIVAALNKVELKEKENNYIHELSGGQKQRVNIARSIVKKSQLFIADEPTGDLDEKTELIIFRILKDIANERLVILVTHNRAIANTYCDRIIELKDGEILYDLDNSIKHTTDDIEIHNNKVFIPKNNNFHIDDWIIIKKLLFEKKQITLVAKETSTKNEDCLKKPDNNQYYRYEGRSIYKKILLDNLKRHWGGRILITLILALLVSFALTAHQIYNFSEAGLVLDTLEKNESTEIAFRRDIMLHGLETRVGDNKLDFISKGDYSLLLDTHFFLDFQHFKEPSLFSFTDIFGISYSQSNSFDLVYGVIDMRRGVLITDYILMILIRYGEHDVPSDIYQNYVSFGDAELFVTGVIDTDFERFIDLDRFSFEYRNLPPELERVWLEFEFKRYTIYARIHLDYPVNEYGFLNNVILNDPITSASLLSFSPENDLDFVSFRTGKGVYLSENLYNELLEEHGEATFISRSPFYVTVLGYVRDGRTEKYNVYVAENFFQVVKNNYLRPDRVLIRDFDYETISYFINSGYIHSSPISSIVGNISFIYNEIKGAFVYVIAIFVFIFTFMAAFYINGTITKRNKKTGVLLAFGIKISDIYKANFFEFIIVACLISIVSILFNNIIGFTINHHVGTNVGIVIQALRPVQYTVIFLPIIIIAIVTVLAIVMTRTQIKKQVVSLIEL